MDIITAASAFSQAHQIINVLLNLKVDSETLAKITSLQAVLAEAQTSQLALLEQNSSLLKLKNGLEKEIARLETWAHESQRYKLHEVQPGVVTYALKESHANGEPAHWLCANCYNNSQKSILMPGEEGNIDRQFTCPRRECGSSFFVSNGNNPEYVP
jgi:hypothetical protein